MVHLKKNDSVSKKTVSNFATNHLREKVIFLSEDDLIFQIRSLLVLLKLKAKVVDYEISFMFSQKKIL